MKSAKVASPLLSCQALRDLLRSPPRKVSLLEADMSKQFAKEFQAGHIPQARYFDQLECTQPTKLIPRGFPEIKCFESYLSRLGVSDSDHIVLYDRSPMGFYASTRAWWLFKTCGLNNLSILNGGFNKWLKEVKEIEATDNAQPEPATGNFTVKFNGQMVKKFDEVLSVVATNNKDTQIVDARGPSAFRGPNGGRLPNALNVPYTDVFDQANQSLKSIDELKTLFSKAGVNLSKPSIYACQTGTTASTLAFIAHLLGQTSYPVYNGSFTEWQQLAPTEYIIRDPPNNPAA